MWHDNYTALVMEETPLIPNDPSHDDKTATSSVKEKYWKHLEY
jgi:hypothetical protein